MKFGWINVFGACVVVIMLLPNTVYAIKHKDMENQCTNMFMNALEQIGRYGCIFLMWMPVFTWKFGFASVGLMLTYVIGNILLLAAYEILWIPYSKKPSKGMGVALAVIPSCIFLLSGLTLMHWPLVGCAVLFAVGHIYVTTHGGQAFSD